MAKKAEDMAALQARLTASVNIARSVVSTWIPADYDSGDTLSTANQTSLNAGEDPSDQIIASRPPRLGIGAKYLSHSQAASFGTAAAMRMKSPAELAADNKLRSTLKIGRKAGFLQARGPKPVARRPESESEEEKESRTTVTKKRKAHSTLPLSPKKKKTKKQQVVRATHDETDEANNDVTVVNAGPRSLHGQFVVRTVPKPKLSLERRQSLEAPDEPPTHAEPISSMEEDPDAGDADAEHVKTQTGPVIRGDFLSQFLSERAGKKKKKKNKKNKSGKQSAESVS